MSKRRFAANRAQRRAARQPSAASLAAAGRQHPTRKPPREHQPTLMSLTMIAGRVNRERIAGSRANPITKPSAGSSPRTVGLRGPTSIDGVEIAAAATPLHPEPPAPSAPADAELQQSDPQRQGAAPSEQRGRHERADRHASVLSAVKIPQGSGGQGSRRHGSGRRRIRDLVLAAGLAAAVVGGIIVTTSWIARSDPTAAVAPPVTDDDQSGVLPSFIGAVPPDVSSPDSQAPAILIWDPETAPPSDPIAGNIDQQLPGPDTGDLFKTDPGSTGFAAPDQQSRGESDSSSRPAGAGIVDTNSRESGTPGSSTDNGQPATGGGPEGQTSDPSTSAQPTAQPPAPQTSTAQPSAETTSSQAPPTSSTTESATSSTVSTSTSAQSSTVPATSGSCTSGPVTTPTVTTTAPNATAPTDQPPAC